jgi:ABC-type polysaccharide/polyol phosphate transport system ATPase subunit
MTETLAADEHRTAADGLGEPGQSAATSADDYAVRVSNLSKYYKLYDNFVTGPIKERIFFWRSDRYFQKFLALRNISLEVRRGERVGIVGPNGSGKTTLLKSIAGLIQFDEGEITVNGRVTALMAHGVGVHPEFSGRENIYFGGLLLGMSRNEVREKMESIIAFSELGEYIDRPFRTYSSGMRARLLFSISMSIDPEILIIDEALSGGDSYFVRKCRRRIEEICASGATVLFVSHDPTQVEELCDRAVLMVNGAIVDAGSPTVVTRSYNRWVFEKERGVAAAETASELAMSSGTAAVRLDRIELLDEAGQATTGFYTGEPMTIRLHYRCEGNGHERVRLFCGILLKPGLQFVGEMDTSFYIDETTGKETEETFDLRACGTIDLSLDPILFINNTYSLWVQVYTKESGYTVFCEYRDVVPFFVARKTHSLSRGPIFRQPFTLRVTDAGRIEAKSADRPGEH